MSHPLTHQQVRRALSLGLVTGLVAVAVLGLGPSGDLPGDAVRATSSALAAVGLPAWATEPRLWALLYNIALLVPVTFAAALLWRRVPVIAWATVGLATSLLVEAVQAVFLSDRTPQLQDLVANSCGALLGAILARCAWQALHRLGAG